MTDSTLLETAVPKLLGWYSENKREMPWRADPSPYRVWISEIMLQQTRIEAVIPYYYRFLRELPTVEALADVADDRLMKLWEGLGYYSRARNLKRAAAEIVRKYGGVLPQTAEKLIALPGIGEYTAGAISSIAYGKPEPAVDGNVLRVVMRLWACADDIALPKTKRRVTEELRAVYPQGAAASALTQALMELGEVVCLPNGKPLCDRCPLNALCRAYGGGNPENYPVKSPKKERQVQQKTVVLLSCRKAYAVRKRGESGLLAGLWEFPNFDGFLSEPSLSAKLKEAGIEPTELKPCGTAVHVFTHIEWHMQGYTVECTERGGDFVWLTAEEITAKAIPTAFRHWVKKLKQ